MAAMQYNKFLIKRTGIQIRKKNIKLFVSAAFFFGISFCLQLMNYSQITMNISQQTIIFSHQIMNISHNGTKAPAFFPFGKAKNK